MPAVVDTRDIDKLVARLNAAGKSLDDVGEIVQKGAKFILDKAQPQMPSKSGTFKSGWSVKKKGSTQATISNKVPHAGPQEFGGYLRRFHSNRKTKYKPIKRPSYFIYPAADANQAGLNELIGEEVRKKLEQKL